MRKYCIVFMLAVVSVAALAWSASATTKPQTFSLIEVSIPKNDRALGEFKFDRPPASGDQFVVKNALVKDGARVGYVRVLHTFITGFGPDLNHKATVLFLAQLYLRGGTMLAEGYGQVTADGPSTLRIPIVGGTGRYSDVRGHLDVRNVTPDRTQLDFKLVP